MLRKNGACCDNPFTSSYNITKNRRDFNNIRQIDGKSFYTKVTKDPEAFEKLFKLVAELFIEIIEDIFCKKIDEKLQSKRNKQDIESLFKKYFLMKRVDDS